MLKRTRIEVLAKRSSARAAWRALAIATIGAVAACGGSIAAGVEDAGAVADAGASQDASAGAGEDASAGSLDGATATVDASSSCGTLSGYCVQRGVCNLEGAAAACGTNGDAYTPSACGGFIVVRSGPHGPPDAPSTVLYYDAASGQLVEVDEYSGASPSHVVCAIGGRKVPAPSSCTFATCPLQTRDAGACPSGLPMSNAPCAREGAVCPVVASCTPTCECFAGEWRCSPAPPCPPPPP